MSDNDTSCEKRIDGELERELARLRSIFERHELFDQWDINPDFDWKEQLLEKRRGHILDSYDAREVWDKLVELENDSDRETIDDYLQGLLSVGKLYTIYQVQLSWGGPSDEFLVYLDQGGEVVKIEYLFKDWFDGAKRELSGDDFDTVAKMVEYLYLGE